MLCHGAWRKIPCAENLRDRPVLDLLEAYRITSERFLCHFDLHPPLISSFCALFKRFPCKVAEVLIIDATIFLSMSDSVSEQLRELAVCPYGKFTLPQWGPVSLSGMATKECGDCKSVFQLKQANGMIYVNKDNGGSITCYVCQSAVQFSVHTYEIQNPGRSLLSEMQDSSFSPDKETATIKIPYCPRCEQEAKPSRSVIEFH